MHLIVINYTQSITVASALPNIIVIKTREVPPLSSKRVIFQYFVNRRKKKGFEKTSVAMQMQTAIFEVNDGNWQNQYCIW